MKKLINDLSFVFGGVCLIIFLILSVLHLEFIKYVLIAFIGTGLSCLLLMKYPRTGLILCMIANGIGMSFYIYHLFRYSRYNYLFHYAIIAFIIFIITYDQN